ncbi:MAG: ABC transporter permease subunit [Anaerolineales bacterium]|nr:ABC transporter permease subunit [Anaerolineales bacterium]
MIGTSTERVVRSEAPWADVVALIWAALATLAALALAGWGVARLVTSPGTTDPTVTVPRYVGAVLAIAAAAVVIVRYARLWRAVAADRDMVRARHTMRVDMLQVFLLVVLAVVLFPLVWILSMSLDPRDFSRPTGLTIIPPGATLRAYVKVLTQPSANPVSFARLLTNSLLVAGGTAALAVVIGTSAAYAFSRLKFPGRRLGMLGFVLVLMIPPGATLAPLFVLLNSVGLRTTLLGLAIAYASTALPFAIWNMKGFVDSLPYDLEEAAQIDGCTRTQGFLRVILPLAAPGMAVTALMGFLTGWSEFILAWTFLTDPSRFTLPMVLRGMTGQYAAGTPWSEFAALSILMSIPAVALFFILQRYLVSGLAAGGVKG